MNAFKHTQKSRRQEQRPRYDLIYRLDLVLWRHPVCQMLMDEHTTVTRVIVLSP